jgi:hypothetical protein
VDEFIEIEGKKQVELIPPSDCLLQLFSRVGSALQYKQQEKWLKSRQGVIIFLILLQIFGSTNLIFA